jgi:hypothetical protein
MVLRYASVAVTENSKGAPAAAGLGARTEMALTGPGCTAIPDEVPNIEAVLASVAVIVNPAPAWVSTKPSVPVPLVSVKLGLLAELLAKLAPAFVLLNWTVPLYAVTALPTESRAVTVTEYAVPEVTM